MCNEDPANQILRFDEVIELITLHLDDEVVDFDPLEIHWMVSVSTRRTVKPHLPCTEDLEAASIQSIKT